MLDVSDFKLVSVGQMIVKIAVENIRNMHMSFLTITCNDLKNCIHCWSCEWAYTAV